MTTILKDGKTRKATNEDLFSNSSIVELQKENEKLKETIKELEETRNYFEKRWIEAEQMAITTIEAHGCDGKKV